MGIFFPFACLLFSAICKASRVEAVAVFTHAFSNTSSEILPLDAPFLVSDTPEYHARVVAVAADHTLKQVDVLLVHASETVFVDYEESEAVACVEKTSSDCFPSCRFDYSLLRDPCCPKIPDLWKL